MQSSAYLSVLLGTSAVLVAPNISTAIALDATEISAIAEEITVQIDGQNPGSGVLVGREGNEYSVLTSAHVVATEDEYAIITTQNQRYSVDYRRVQKNKGVDLAVVKFTSTQNYKVAKLGDSSKIRAGANVFVSGFPMKTAAITQRILNFASGSVTAHPSNPLEDGYALIYETTLAKT